MNVLAFIDARADADLLLQPVRSVALALWPLRFVAGVLTPAQIVVVTADARIAALFKPFGVRAVRKPPVGPLRIDPLQPFASPRALRLALAGRVSELGLLQNTAIEEVRVHDADTLELARAVAAGLATDHPCAHGLAALALPGAAHIEAVVCDVDGTLTDGGIGFADGEHAHRTFNTHDGLGTRMLIEAGIQVAWLSATSSAASITRRAAMLGVQVVDAGKGHKGPRFKKVCRSLGVAPARALYMGDDVNDLPAIELAGASACPSDARPEVRGAVDLVLDAPGGRGALRELADLLLAARDGAAKRPVRASSARRRSESARRTP